MPKKGKVTEMEVLEMLCKDSIGTLIFCHGLGDDPKSWLFLANELQRNLNLKIILVRAPTTYVSVNKIDMPSWFDILEIPIKPNMPDNGQYLDDSVNILNNIINLEVSNGVSLDKIILGGFSQGATLSLVAGLKYKERLGGIFMFSGWKHLKLMLNNYYNCDIPVLISHGDKDKIVLYENALNLIDELSKYKFKKITFNSYSGMGHNTSTKEISDLILWINQICKN